MPGSALSALAPPRPQLGRLGDAGSALYDLLHPQEPKSGDTVTDAQLAYLASLPPPSSSPSLMDNLANFLQQLSDDTKKVLWIGGGLVVAYYFVPEIIKAVRSK